MDGKLDISQFIRRVMPDATDAELSRASETFDEYMVVVWDIFRRHQRDHGNNDSQNVALRGRVDELDNDV